MKPGRIAKLSAVAEPNFIDYYRNKEPTKMSTVSSLSASAALETYNGFWLANV